MGAEENGSEITVRTQSPAEMISMAIAGRADLDKLERLLILQERWEANEARKAYHKAMSDFKANPPEIIKDKHVKFNTSKGTMDYKHATLGNVCEEINASLSKFHLSASWITKQDEKVKIGVITRITHEKGHSEETVLWGAADDSGLKNSIQAMGSTITYLQRYGLLALTGLATKEGDDDGKKSEIEYIDEKQCIELQEWIMSMEVNPDNFLKWLKVESIDKIKKEDFNKALNGLKTAKERKK